MNKILVTALKNKKDVLASSVVVSAIKKQFPHSEIHLLTYKSDRDYAQLINHVAKIQTIDKEKITNIATGPLFSDGFALNEFFNNLKEIKATQWDIIVNLSNDQVSSTLISSLKTDKVLGVHIRSNGTLKTSDEWSIINNNLNYPNQKPIVEPYSIYAHMVNSPWQSDFNRLKLNSEFSLIANENFKRIRDSYKNKQAKLIGVSIAQGYDGGFLDDSNLAKLVTGLYDSEDYIPVLLISQKNSQHKETVNTLNQQVGNNLISINIDTSATTAIMPNLDLLISTANSHLQIADLLETECIELRDGTSFRNNPIISLNESKVIFTENAETLIDDIFVCLNEKFDTQLPIETLKSENPTFLCLRDDYGYFYTQIRGPIDDKIEIDSHVSRAVFYHCMGYPLNNEILEEIRDNCDRDTLTQYVDELRGELTGVVKVLLATLRSLKEMRNSQESLNKFLKYFDNLIEYGGNQNLIGKLIRFNESKIENIESETAQENLVEIEKILFNLKSHFQIITEVAGRLTTSTKSIASDKVLNR